MIKLYIKYRFSLKSIVVPHSICFSNSTLKRIIKRNILWFLSSIALLIYVLQRLEVNLPEWINNYVNDFLCIPLVLAYTTLLFRYLKKEPFFKFSIWYIFLTALYYSLYFELYLPGVNIRYTADVCDVILYFFGGVFYYVLQRLGYI